MRVEASEVFLDIARVYGADGQYALSNLYLDSAYALVQAESERFLADNQSMRSYEILTRDAEIERQRLTTQLAQSKARVRLFGIVAALIVGLLGAGLGYQQWVYRTEGSRPKRSARCQQQCAREIQ